MGLNFSKSNSDTLRLSGTVTLPLGFLQSGKLVFVDIGGVIRRFALDADGKSSIGSDSISFKFQSSSTTIGAGAADTGSFVLFMRNASAADVLAQSGLTNSTLVKVPRIVPVYVLLNTSLNTVQQPQVYTAKKGKSGKSKNP